MANSLEILLIARDQFSEPMQKYGAALGLVSKQADEAAAKVEAAGKKAATFSDAANKIDASASKMRMGLSAASQAASTFGLDISSTLGPMASLSDAAGDLANTVGSLGMAAGAIGILVTAFAALNTVMAERNRTIAESILKNDEWVQSIERVSQGGEKVTAMLKEFAAAQAQVQTGWSWDIGDIVDRWMQFDTVGRGAAEALRMLGKEARDLAPWLETSAQKAARLKNELNNLVYAAAEAGAQLKTLKGEADAFIGGKGGAGTGTDGKGPPPRYERDRKALNLLAASAEKATAALKGLVEGALNPTTVAARMNMTADAWDEFRLRLEAVATGTDPAQYGEQFKGMYEELLKLGYSADTAAAAFKNFTLFTDPKNIKLVDMAPIVEQVKTQLDSMIGKANLVSAAMAEVWKNLNPQQKAALGAQGINNTADAVQALIDPAGQAQEKAEGLQSALNNIPHTITTTFNVMYEAAEAKINLFREVLDKFIADYGSVTISINAETSATPPPPGGAPPSPPSTPPSAGGTPFATGGFVVPKGYNNDTYPVRVNLSSDEILHVFNPNRPTAGGNSTQPIYISIDGSPFRRISDRRVSGMAALGQGI